MNNIKDKIRKLLALSKSSNENEAALAAKRAQELLEKYNLTIDKVTNEISEILIEFGRETKWKTILLNSCAKAFFSLMVAQVSLNSKGKDILRAYKVYGRPHNIDVTLSMYNWLVSVITQMSRANCKRMRKQKSRNSYKLGMTYSIAEKLLRKNSSYSTDPTNSLIHDLYASERKLIEDYIGESLMTEKSKAENTTAFRKGLIAGQDVNVHDQVNDSSLKQVLIA